MRLDRQKFIRPARRIPAGEKYRKSPAGLDRFVRFPGEENRGGPAERIGVDEPFDQSAPPSLAGVTQLCPSRAIRSSAAPGPQLPAA
ncbi:MAG: hypothetical protein H6Q84_2498 [Deltaproteobacteria bacterium]|nr:hypothetical protein [Deltaproteobacteria bacterium]